MLIDLFRYGFSFETVAGVAASVFVLFCTLPIHEFAHAWTATRLGDDTARLKGRLTLNPLAHLDPLGSILILLVGFGYAKPVPVNMRNFKKRKKPTDDSVYSVKNSTLGISKKYMAITALAGPVSNLIMAFFFLLLSGFPKYFAVSGGTTPMVFFYFFYYAALINVSLAVFNLLPVPPLDGSRIFGAILPDKYYYTVMQYERQIMIGLFVLLATGILTRPIVFLSRYVFIAIQWLAALPFRPFM